MSGEAAAVKIDVTTRVLHLGLATFGIAAWLLGLTVAGDYDEARHTGYLVHMVIGLTFTTFLALRLLYGIFGPVYARFSSWVPWTKARWLLVMDDIKMLLRLRIPDRASHEGFAGLVQTLGLLAFVWIGCSGTSLSILITPGVKLTGWQHNLKEAHQVGQILIPAYLALHVGAVLLHALSGRHVWRKMIFLK